MREARTLCFGFKPSANKSSHRFDQTDPLPILSRFGGSGIISEKIDLRLCVGHSFPFSLDLLEFYRSRGKSKQKRAPAAEKHFRPAMVQAG
jgi:hypothetical protein